MKFTTSKQRLQLPVTVHQLREPILAFSGNLPDVLLCFDGDLLKLFHSRDVCHATQQNERRNRPLSASRIVATADLHRSCLLFEPLAPVLNPLAVEVLRWTSDNEQRPLRSVHLTG